MGCPRRGPGRRRLGFNKSQICLKRKWSQAVSIQAKFAHMVFSL